MECALRPAQHEPLGQHRFPWARLAVQNHGHIREPLCEQRQPEFGFWPVSSSLKAEVCVQLWRIWLSHSHLLAGGRQEDRIGAEWLLVQVKHSGEKAIADEGHEPQERIWMHSPKKRNGCPQ